MAKMGLRQSANRDIRPAANRAAARAVPGGKLVEADEVSRLFGESFMFFLCFCCCIFLVLFIFVFCCVSKPSPPLTLTHTPDDVRAWLVRWHQVHATSTQKKKKNAGRHSPRVALRESPFQLCMVLR